MSVKRIHPQRRTPRTLQISTPWICQPRRRQPLIHLLSLCSCCYAPLFTFLSLHSCLYTPVFTPFYACTDQRRPTTLAVTWGFGLTFGNTLYYMINCRFHWSTVFNDRPFRMPLPWLLW